MKKSIQIHSIHFINISSVERRCANAIRLMWFRWSWPLSWIICVDLKVIQLQQKLTTIICHIIDLQNIQFVLCLVMRTLHLSSNDINRMGHFRNEIENRPLFVMSRDVQCWWQFIDSWTRYLQLQAHYTSRLDGIQIKTMRHATKVLLMSDSKPFNPTNSVLNSCIEKYESKGANHIQCIRSHTK